MADSYTIIATNRTVQVKSSSLVEDVMEIHAETVPDGVTFVREVSYKKWEDGGYTVQLEKIASHIEGILKKYPQVVDGDAVQEITPAGLLRNSVAFTVQVYAAGGNGGPLEDTVTITVEKLHDHTDFSHLFDPVINRLGRAAGAGAGGAQSPPPPRPEGTGLAPAA